MRIAFPYFNSDDPAAHLSADLAIMSKDLGHEPFLLMMESGKSTSSGFSAAISQCSPDILVAVNATRQTFHPAVPPSIPVASFMMDGCDDVNTLAFSSAFNSTPRDILIGYTFDAPSSGYDPSRLHLLPVPTSPRKFFNPVRFSMTPPANTASFCGERGYDPINHATNRSKWFRSRGIHPNDVLSAIVRLKALQQIAPLHPTEVESIFLKGSSISRLSLSLPPAEWDMFFRVHFLFPLYEPIYRQSVLKRYDRTHSLTIHGSDYLANRDFKHLAHPRIPHGPRLADAYASSSISLHISSLFNHNHHRMNEILISGGTLHTVGPWPSTTKRLTLSEASSFLDDQLKQFIPLFSGDLFPR